MSDLFCEDSLYVEEDFFSERRHERFFPSAVNSFIAKPSTCNKEKVWDMGAQNTFVTPTRIRGQWEEDVKYCMYNIVFHNEDVYMCIKANMNKVPDDVNYTKFWKRFPRIS